MKKWLMKYLEGLAKANKKEFGGKPLDCCKLNAQKPAKKDS